MPVHLRREQCCTAVLGGRRCLRPASELGGLCSQCWRGLSPEKRDVLRWQAELDVMSHDTVEIPAVDPRAAAEVRWLEALFQAPAAESERRG